MYLVNEVLLLFAEADSESDPLYYLKSWFCFENSTVVRKCVNLVEYWSRKMQCRGQLSKLWTPRCSEHFLLERRKIEVAKKRKQIRGVLFFHTALRRRELLRNVRLKRWKFNEKLWLSSRKRLQFENDRKCISWVRPLRGTFTRHGSTKLLRGRSDSEHHR